MKTEVNMVPYGRKITEKECYSITDSFYSTSVLLRADCFFCDPGRLVSNQAEHDGELPQ